MAVRGYVGLMGSGKTRLVVREGLDARAAGREVYANFRMGERTRGWMVPLCGRAYHAPLGQADHEAERYEFRRASPILDVWGRERGWRTGRGFLSWSTDTRVGDRTLIAPQLLTSWAQLQALRVHRDELGAVHRTTVVEDGVDDEGETTYRTERACAVYDCTGCSKGITVLIDELNLWAPSRLWTKLGLGVLERWAYARKDGLDIVWSAQHEARVDKVAREVTEHVYTCSSIGGRAGKVRLQLFQRRRWIPALMTEKNRVISGEGMNTAGGAGGFEWPEFVIRFGGRLTTREEESYDTFEHVASSGHLARAPKGREAPEAREVVALRRRSAS